MKLRCSLWSGGLIQPARSRCELLRLWNRSSLCMGRLENYGAASDIISFRTRNRECCDSKLIDAGNISRPCRLVYVFRHPTKTGQSQTNDTKP